MEVWSLNEWARCNRKKLWGSWRLASTDTRLYPDNAEGLGQKNSKKKCSKRSKWHLNNRKGGKREPRGG